MTERDEYLNNMMATEDGKNLLYELSVNAPDIVFALRADAENHKKIGWMERYNDLMNVSKSVCRLAQATGKYMDF